ncbi:hypothetical protein JB92DRAFT_3111216 [Gautieria morchelliformis]|nr:hypothetical protein JB92DRAFT_3111216 [Gautieria morchelliformis]
MTSPWIQPVYGWSPPYPSPGYWQYVPTPYAVYHTLPLAVLGQEIRTRGHHAIQPQRVELQLHRFLGGHPKPTAVWDVSQEVLTAQRLTSRNSLQMVTPRFLAHPATEPPVSRMNIVCEPFKWDIKIHIPPGAPDKFITIGLILESIHGILHQPLDPEDWREIGPSEKRKIYKAMCARLAKNPPSIKAAGRVLKIDSLLDRTRFLGLRPGTAGPEEWILSLAPKG